MALFEKIAKRFGFIPRGQVRRYDAAQPTRFAQGWITQGHLIDADVKRGLRPLRARSRNEAQNNGYYKGFLRDLKENVIGNQGIQLISLPMDSDTAVDKEAKRTIERHWRLWGHKMNRPNVAGLSWNQTQKLIIQSAAQDGEVFIWEKPGTNVNQYRYSVQIIDPDAIDTMLEKDMPNGGAIFMGVEFDKDKYPVAYWMKVDKNNNPDYKELGHTGDKHVRIPSTEMIHVYLHDGVWMSRGVPWIAPALLRFNQLNKYEEAELIAARAGASKMGFITDGEDGSGYTGDDDEETADDDYLYEELEPGVIGRLKNGQEFHGFNPDHPNTAFGDFVKINLRGIAAALGESYNQFAQDLEGVSFGSLRQGALSERAVYMGLQDWLIEEAFDRMFLNWLGTSLIAGAITNRNGAPLPSARFDKFAEHEWQPRRWDWIDPLKDASADRLQWQDKAMSLSERIRKRGRQPNDVFQEIAAENVLMDELGITSAQVGANIGGNGNGEDDDTDENGESAEDRIARLEAIVLSLEE